MKANQSTAAIFMAAMLVITVLAVTLETSAGEEQKPARIVAYYFHGKNRCATCLRIESYARTVLEEYFKAQIDQGTIVFKVINVQERENEHFIQDYQLRSWSLVLSLVRNGQEISYENLARVWEYAHDKPRFFSYVHGEIKELLALL